ncbi:hypothetical protein ACFX2A_004425 [Malus domestica]
MALCDICGSFLVVNDVVERKCCGCFAFFGGKKNRKKTETEPKKTEKNLSRTELNRNFGLVSVLAKNRTDQNPTQPYEQAHMVRSVKSRRIPLLSSPVFKSPSDRIQTDDVFEASNPYVLVTESGSPNSKFLGYVAGKDWVKLGDKEVKIYDYMVNCMDFTVPWSYDLGAIGEYMEEKKRDVVATVRDNEVVDVVANEEVERIKGYPKFDRIVISLIRIKGKLVILICMSCF